jgi:hypothetical protein
MFKKWGEKTRLKIKKLHMGGQSMQRKKYNKM